MIQKNNSYFVFLALLLMSAGCAMPEYIDLPRPDPKITVYSVTEASAPFSVVLSLSQPIQERENFVGVPNAMVRLYENGLMLEQLTCAQCAPEKPLEFTAVARPAEGARYSIEVEAEGYPRVSSTYVHPQAVAIDSFAIEIIPSDPFNEARLRINFTDPPGENFYQIFFVASSEAGFANQVYSLLSMSVNKQYSDTFAGRSSFFADTNMNGPVTINFRAGLDTGPFEYYRAVLRTVSKEYYFYSKEAVQQGQANLDPYAQPVRIESNIQNGIGIFGGYTETQRTVTLE